MGGDGFVYGEAPHDQMVKNDTQMCISLSSRTKCVSMLSCPYLHNIYTDATNSADAAKVRHGAFIRANIISVVNFRCP